MLLYKISPPMNVSEQENDLRYLVEKIWNSQSIVSAWDDLYDLILVRWDKHKEWSPWNCVLLTKEESSAHERLETLSEVRRWSQCNFYKAILEIDIYVGHKCNENLLTQL